MKQDYIFKNKKTWEKMVLFHFFSSLLTVWSNGKQMETHLLSQSVCWKCFLVEINKENPTYRDMQLEKRGVFLQSFQIIVHIIPWYYTKVNTWLLLTDFGVVSKNNIHKKEEKSGRCCVIEGKEGKEVLQEGSSQRRCRRHIVKEDKNPCACWAWSMDLLGVMFTEHGGGK